MNNVRRSEGVLSARATFTLFDLVAQKGRTPQEIANHLVALESVSAPRTLNTVQLMAEIGVLRIDDGIVVLHPQARQVADLNEFVRSAILIKYLSLLSSSNLGSIFQLKNETNEIWIDRLQLPFRELGYPYLLLEFGVAIRDSTEDRFWRVTSESADSLLEALRGLSLQPYRKRQFSLDDLKKLQQARERAGREAESFVVSYEKRRIAAHPFVESVRIISDEDTGAGFDILSFDTDRNLTHNRFIEVKSYAEEESFYWSDGEMTSAKEHGDRYWLYLVDRRKLNEQGYEPEALQDPYTYFLIHKPLNWSVEPQSFKFTRLN